MGLLIRLKRKTRPFRDLIHVIIIVFVLTFILILFEPEPLRSSRFVHSTSKSKYRSQIDSTHLETKFRGARNGRQMAVVKAFEHAWQGYRQYAWGHDNLKPLSRIGTDWFGLGLTLIDSLTTMVIMNLNDDFVEAREWVKNDFRSDIDVNVNMFEVMIRVVGGFLSTYHLTNDPLFLIKASEVGEKLSMCFVNTATGIPNPWINLKTAQMSDYKTTSLSEAGSVQIELRALGWSLANGTYVEWADRANAAIHELNHVDGLRLADIRLNGDKITDGEGYSVGGRVDSYYEYLLKQWIQMGKPDNHQLLIDYKAAIDGMIKHLVRTTGGQQHTIIGASTTEAAYDAALEHLACYLPGTLLLGFANGLPHTHYKLAVDLLDSCYAIYRMNPTHLAAEKTHFDMDTGAPSISFGENVSLLRPEFIESLYYFWVFTGNTTYQDWGWDVFMAFEKYAKVENGYTSVYNVDAQPPAYKDHMESFFLSETLKYLYLLFSDDRDEIDLSKFVFNTEAHPLLIKDSAEEASRHVGDGPRQPFRKRLVDDSSANIDVNKA